MEQKICGAKAKSTGKPCQHEAGWGTDHPGEGRCKFHGGRSRKGAESGTFKHGQDSKYFDPSSMVGFDEWRATVGPTLDLEEDLLAMIYQVREMVLKRESVQVVTKDGPILLVPDAEYISKCLGRITAAWERMVKRREGETIHVKLAQPEIERAFETVGEVIADTIEDPALARQVGEAIAKALAGIGGGEA